MERKRKSEEDSGESNGSRGAEDFSTKSKKNKSPKPNRAPRPKSQPKKKKFSDGQGQSSSQPQPLEGSSCSSSSGHLGLGTFGPLSLSQPQLSPSTSNFVSSNSAAREKERMKKLELVLMNKDTTSKVPTALHNPKDEGALVLYPYPSDPGHQLGMGQVNVVVDPRLSSDLQKHQIQGVIKMYEWLMSKPKAGFILADEPGLGKTLQVLTVLWTLLTQSSRWDKRACKVVPSIQKAIVVCPKNVILVWRDEIKRWLTPSGQGATTEVMKVLVMDDRISSKKKKEEATKFMNKEDLTYQCLICSYDEFVNLGKDYQENDEVNDDLLNGPLAENTDGVVGMMILDEAHYIKNSGAERTKFVLDFNVKKKIALTGTPMPNNISEYRSIINFVEPTAFSKTKLKVDFNEIYQRPIKNWIANGRKPNERPRAVSMLRRIVRPFFIRRRNNPFVTAAKNEFIICCKMSKNTENDTDRQFNLFNGFATGFKDQRMSPHESPDLLDGEEEVVVKKKSKKTEGGVTAFQAIAALKNICTHPLFKIGDAFNNVANSPHFFNFREMVSSFSQEAYSEILDPNLSAKLTVLANLLCIIRYDKDKKKDRVVIVSSSTEVLKLIEKMLERLQGDFFGRMLTFPYRRFDGKTSQRKRKKIIDRINDLSNQEEFILTLSSKAGGTGISLTGANHLILFDPDWNPANDEQAMMRIYREGQKKDCYIYRLLTSGSIEEVIFQKQMYKKIFSGTIIDEENNECIITDDMLANEQELNALFEPILDSRDSPSYTHKEINCSCEPGQRRITGLDTNNQQIHYLEHWDHHSDKGTLSVDCQVLNSAWAADEDSISFVFHQKKTPQHKSAAAVPGTSAEELAFEDLSDSEDFTD